MFFVYGCDFSIFNCAAVTKNSNRSLTHTYISEIGITLSHMSHMSQKNNSPFLSLPSMLRKHTRLVIFSGLLYNDFFFSEFSFSTKKRGKKKQKSKNETFFFFFFFFVTRKMPQSQKRGKGKQDPPARLRAAPASGGPPAMATWRNGAPPARQELVVAPAPAGQAEVRAQLLCFSALSTNIFFYFFFFFFFSSYHVDWQVRGLPSLFTSPPLRSFFFLFFCRGVCVACGVELLGIWCMGDGVLIAGACLGANLGFGFCDIPSFGLESDLQNGGADKVRTRFITHSRRYVHLEFVPSDV
jgi:hypothetical protein